MELYLRVRQACAAGMSQRQAAKAFNISLSHYLIRDRYGRPGKGNE